MGVTCQKCGQICSPDIPLSQDSAPKAQGTATAPPSRPLGALDRAHLLSAGAPPKASAAAKAGASPSVAAGESAPARRELRWKFEDEERHETTFLMRVLF